MGFNSGEEVANFLKDIVYLDTQVSEKGFDLTVSKIYKPENKGEIDFGGSERVDSEISEIKPSLKNPEDDYGWWELETGDYLIEFNESLKENHLIYIEPLPRITRNMATHPSCFKQKLDLIQLHVGGKGISIKENSRISKARIFDF